MGVIRELDAHRPVRFPEPASAVVRRQHPRGHDDVGFECGTKERRAGRNDGPAGSHARPAEHSYLARHGFPFIICVRHYTREGIFAALERRIERGTQQEQDEALAQIASITRGRLDRAPERAGLIDDGRPGHDSGLGFSRQGLRANVIPPSAIRSSGFSKHSSGIATYLWKRMFGSDAAYVDGLVCRGRSRRGTACWCARRKSATRRSWRKCPPCGRIPCSASGFTYRKTIRRSNRSRRIRARACARRARGRRAEASPTQSKIFRRMNRHPSHLLKPSQSTRCAAGTWTGAAQPVKDSFSALVYIESVGDTRQFVPETAIPTRRKTIMRSCVRAADSGFNTRRDDRRAWTAGGARACFAGTGSRRTRSAEMRGLRSE